MEPYIISFVDLLGLIQASVSSVQQLGSVSCQLYKFTAVHSTVGYCSTDCNYEEMSMIGENIAIAVAEVVRSKDGIDSNDLNQEIDQRIASVISEIERKSAEIEAVEGEVRALKKSLVPLLGSAFIRRQ